MLAMMNQSFSRAWVKESHVFRAPYAQAVFMTNNFVDLIPATLQPRTGAVRD